MIAFNSTNYPYHSKRSCVYAKNGMVATSQPLAAQAGLEILKKGGNAIDAAIATAACLTVVEPTSNGIGSDSFALVWTKGKLHGLNASGFAPKALSIEKLKRLGYTKIPMFGMVPITVPGTPKGWASLSKKFGKLPLIDVLKPAIKYAREGFPVSPTTAYYWERAYARYQEVLKGEQFSSWFETFAKDGKTPKVGEMWRSEGHARTLELIGLTEADAFYSGELADKIDAYMKQYNGFLDKTDLKEYDVEYVKPISINYKGYDVWEIPPNGQGITALMALNILKNDQFEIKEDAHTYHYQIEAMKLAFSDSLHYVTDSKDMRYTSNELLTDAYGKKRRSLITEEAGLPKPGTPPKGGTVYLATADGEGNMVSYIQSNYMGFGSGVVIPNTGIAMQNRGHNFSFDETHDNHLAPRKRPYHTIIPGFLTKDHNPIGPFGVMGGFMQPQGHLQVIMNTIEFKLNPQAALDAPRWQWMKDKVIEVEPNINPSIIEDLRKRGHTIVIQPKLGGFGRGQIIWRNPETKVLIGGTEFRTDGEVASW